MSCHKTQLVISHLKERVCCTEKKVPAVKNRQDPVPFSSSFRFIHCIKSLKLTKVYSSSYPVTGGHI